MEGRFEGRKSEGGTDCMGRLRTMGEGDNSFNYLIANVTMTPLCWAWLYSWWP